ncbi:hypothetical protein SS1G_06361 [Sclerotinia sclerotiorum 1980 UF-70]|uniref:Transcription factor domain-containing protein n=1 Tax=Sclerotinia sclerotiorum (strain ATCC 18683 / 1980 / Ss-1) TaxID=665079 RepID=A7EM14_SCLS1|nr:hypothetical protein SS1G_06361 [Sclerotinia sclerotiorum 1980 UF-70]EDO03880.1 hypothetical protein SS1G_06361 [Sclerotinia sclerotiorum 1980 UF-70]
MPSKFQRRNMPQALDALSKPLAYNCESHHKQIFKDDNPLSPTPLKEIPLPLPSKYIPGRKLTLSQATHLLNSYIPKLPFFPFVTLPANPTIPTLSQQSPFLLLAILTTAAIPHPYLHHQLDQEFRRVLSLKLIVNSQKSLDYLLGLLVYIAWYPMHTKPKSNPCFTYMNLANSLAVDLGLDKAEPQTNIFGEFDLKGLVRSDGRWTTEAKRAYMGCYVLCSQLAIGFSKPQTMSYENLLPSNPDSFIPSHTSTPATAMVILERISDRTNDAWTLKNYPQMDAFSTELYVQLFTAELDTWKRNVPEYITASLQSLVALVRLTFVIAHVENWSAETTRERIGLSMYLEALCFRLRGLSSTFQSSSNKADLESSESETIDISSNKGQKEHFDKYFVLNSMLSTLKKTWEQRVEAIVPKASTLSRGKCPVFHPEVAPLLGNTNLDFDFEDMHAWDEGLGAGTMGWDVGVGVGEAGSSGDNVPYTGESFKKSGQGQEQVGLQGVSSEGEGGMGMGMGISGIRQQEGTETMNHDLWDTMTCSWAEQSSTWPIAISQGNSNMAGNEEVFRYQGGEQ